MAVWQYYSASTEYLIGRRLKGVNPYRRLQISLVGRTPSYPVYVENLGSAEGRTLA